MRARVCAWRPRAQHPIELLARAQTKRLFRAPTLPAATMSVHVNFRDRDAAVAPFLVERARFSDTSSHGVARHAQFERRSDTAGKVSGQKKPHHNGERTPLLRQVAPAIFELINLVLAVSYPLSPYVSIEGEIGRITLGGLSVYQFRRSDQRRELISP